jgi:Tol biopolymer transport system component
MLVTVVSNQISNIQIAAKGDLGRANQITSGIADGAYGLSWAPDGRIVYQSSASGRWDIWIMNADGSNQRQLTHDGRNFSPSVSSDGRYIVYASIQADKCNIWRMNVDGSNSKQLTDGIKDTSAQISPDGRWVVYDSWDFEKRVLRKAPIDGGASVQLTEPAERAAFPIISPNGKHIASYYYDQQVNPPYGVMILSFEGGQPTKRFKRIDNDILYVSDQHWAPDGSALMYIDNSLSNILSQPINGGDPVGVTNFQGEQIFNFDWSRDGKWLALARGRIMNDVMLVRDFN